ncbi:MAG: hypothetical protein ACXVBP_01470 [Flavisolibacter sp.]
MYQTHHRKSRNRTEDKQLVKGIVLFFLLAAGLIALILGGLLN